MSLLATKGDTDLKKRCYTKWSKEQLELKSKLVTEDTFQWTVEQGKDNTLKYVGGVDISFVKDSEVDACACFVVSTYPECKVVYSKCEMVQLTQPYIPGFLAFREVEFLQKLIEELRQSQPSLLPDVILVDGNGILHPRGFGLASHLGVLVGIPTVGIGKTFFHVENLNGTDMKERAKKELSRGGDHFQLEGSSGTVWGAALQSTDDTTLPVYVSIGTHISLHTAVKLTAAVCKYRIPEPVRQADLVGRDFVRQLTKQNKGTTQGAKQQKGGKARPDVPSHQSKTPSGAAGPHASAHTHAQPPHTTPPPRPQPPPIPSTGPPSYLQALLSKPQPNAHR
eukprot:GFYU01003578.1.p1 GENE.GFYU01003578.1~~GFYU01003578.1.p1  ORF type:complete len:375 (-),score=94.34 GFYU01003578.1:99-1112(-)